MNAGWGEGRARSGPDEPDRPRSDVEEEIRFHLEGRTRELVERGMDPEAARREALRRFGDVARIQEECRSLDRQRTRREERVERMGAIAKDVRYALRGLRRSPAFTAAALLTLALGVGAATAVFSVLDAVVLRPLPFRDPDRLVVLWETNPQLEIARDNVSPANFVDWRDANRTLQDMAAFQDLSMTLTGVEQPEVLSGVTATANLFGLLGVEATLGRTFRPGEDGPDAGGVVVLSHTLWRTRFGGDPGVVGTTLLLNRRPVEVVGVAPPGFDVPRPGIDFWIPGHVDPTVHRRVRMLRAIGRLRPGVTVEQAREDLNRIAATLDERYPDSNRAWRVLVVPAHEEVVGEARQVVILVFGAVALLLLAACANVATLLLGRAAVREREMAVRAALGASRGRLRRQLLTESLVLALAGALLAAGVAYAGIRLLVSLDAGEIPRLHEVGVDGRVLAFALGTSVLTAVLFGLAPALRLSRTGVAGALGGGGARAVLGFVRGDRTRTVLVAGEVATSLVLLVGAGLLLRSLLALGDVHPGFAREGVLAARVTLSAETYRTGPERVRYYEALVERLARVTGVEGVAVTSTLPLTPAGIDFAVGYRPEGRPPAPEGEEPQAGFRIVSPGYPESVGMPLLAGRDLTSDDRAETRRVVLVNRALAERAWPGEDPLGRLLTIQYGQPLEWEVVGVVGNTRHAGLGSAPEPQLFIPISQTPFPFGFMTVVVRRAGGAPSDLPQHLRAAALEVDPAQPLYRMETVEGLLSEALARERFLAWVVATFAVLAAVLAAAGIYGVVSFQVARGTREIGLRMALGAGRAGLVGAAVARAAGLAAGGVLVGLPLALLASRALGSLLYGVPHADPATYAGVAFLLLGAAVAAAYVPARRAAGIDPMEALRAD